jgi:hypothetical protein
MTRPQTLALAILLLLAGVGPAVAQGPAVRAKQFPTSYFYQYRQAPLKDKEQELAQIDATLKKLNREKLGLIAKGAVIDKLGPHRKIYDRLTILDESGLIIIARRVPNIYYRYAGPAPINPNIYLVLKNARVNFRESYIRYGFVVEGDYLAYAHKFVTAILEHLENAAAGEVERSEKGKVK